MERSHKDLEDRITESLSAQPYRHFKTKELANLLKVAPKHYKEFRSLLRQMAANGAIAKYKTNRFGASKTAPIAIGKLHVKSQGYGFLLTPEGEDDIFLSLKNMGTALDGDQVKVQLFARTSGKRPEGRVVEVIQRARKCLVGTLKKGKHYYFVEPDDLKIARNIYVYDGGLNGAKIGQKVAVEIDLWEDELLNPEGHVTEILGFPGETGVDVLSVAVAFNLPLGFPEQVEKAAAEKTGAIAPALLRGRVDLRELVCFTIDPQDAKDFDDAVSLRRLDNGNYELGVHIADVSHYVDEGSPVDNEALERGTSVYLVDRVIPMLPEYLSNDLCSLKPDVDRLTFTCMMEVTPAGEVVSHRLFASVIHSKRRFAYEEVQAFWDRKLDLPDALAAPLTAMMKLARALRRQRLHAGSLDFDIPEAKVILDEKGFPVDIRRRDRLESMQMIEEFMLLANQTVALHIEGMRSEEGPPPFIYRVHEKPAVEKINEFCEFVQALGYEFSPGGRLASKKLSDFLRRIENREEKTIIESVMLRSLMKARYDVENLGHFGLAFKHYTHFTSPIRRYPDLAVHRLLKFYAQEGWHEQLRGPLTKKLDQICEQSSEREVAAQEAERASIKMKQVQFMASRLGEEFDGLISGVVQFGVFVEITEYLVEGLVHISDLPDDFYSFNEKTYRLEGIATGRIFRLGDAVRVRVVRVDPDERIIDFILVEKETHKKKKQGKIMAEKQDDRKDAALAAEASKPAKTPRKKKAAKADEPAASANTLEEAKADGETSKRTPVSYPERGAKRQLTRADDDRTIFTTMRSSGRGGRANTGRQNGNAGPSKRRGGKRNSPRNQRPGNRNASPRSGGGRHGKKR